jgi:hypothetical protein
MPSVVTDQVSPESALCQTPPQDTATRSLRASRGSMHIEWMPG